MTLAESLQYLADNFVNDFRRVSRADQAAILGGLDAYALEFLPGVLAAQATPSVLWRLGPLLALDQHFREAWDSVTARCREIYVAGESAYHGNRRELL